MPTTTKQSNTTATLALCAVIGALVSFFLPLYSVNFLVNLSQSAMEVIAEGHGLSELPEGALIISLGCAVVALLFALIAIKARGAGVGTVLASIGGAAMMLVAMSDDSYYVKLIDYASTGFYLHIGMCCAAIVLSIIAMSEAKNVPTVAEETTAKDETATPAPVKTPVVPPVAVKMVCSNCKAEFDHKVAFCRFCGTPMEKAAPAETPEVIPAPAPDTKPIAQTPDSAPDSDTANQPRILQKDGKVVCPHCGARHKAGTVHCKYCGTEIKTDSNPVVSVTPAAESDITEPVSVVMPKREMKDMTARKAICPHCGARQNEDSENCKYCGTKMP